jgi:hypothetical protein
MDMSLERRETHVVLLSCGVLVLGKMEHSQKQ